MRRVVIFCSSWTDQETKKKLILIFQLLNKVDTNLTKENFQLKSDPGQSGNSPGGSGQAGEQVGRLPNS